MGTSLAECAEVSLSAPSPCEVSREATAPPLSVCSGELITVCRLNEARSESSQNVPAQAAFSVTPTGADQPFRYSVSHGLSSYIAPHSGGRGSISGFRSVFAHDTHTPPAGYDSQMAGSDVCVSSVDLE